MPSVSGNVTHKQAGPQGWVGMEAMQAESLGMGDDSPKTGWVSGECRAPQSVAGGGLASVWTHESGGVPARCWYRSRRPEEGPAETLEVVNLCWGGGAPGPELAGELLRIQSEWATPAFCGKRGLVGAQLRKAPPAYPRPWCIFCSLEGLRSGKLILAKVC